MESSLFFTSSQYHEIAYFSFTLQFLLFILSPNFPFSTHGHSQLLCLLPFPTTTHIPFSVITPRIPCFDAQHCQEKKAPKPLLRQLETVAGPSWRDLLEDVQWSGDTTFHKCVQEHSTAAMFLNTMDAFKPAQWELCPPEHLVLVKDKKTEKKGVRKNDHCLV